MIFAKKNKLWFFVMKKEQRCMEQALATSERAQQHGQAEH